MDVRNVDVSHWFTDGRDQSLDFPFLFDCDVLQPAAEMTIIGQTEGENLIVPYSLWPALLTY